MLHRPEYEKARGEAFGWYVGAPPSANEAWQHFTEKVSRDPANAHIYDEALRIFLATCWPGQSPPG